MTENLTADGVTTTFTTLSLYIPGSLKVYVDGIRYALDDDYTETAAAPDVGNGFEMATPVPVGSTFVIDYDIVGGGLIASGS